MKRVFRVISSRAMDQRGARAEYVADADAAPIAHKPDDLLEIRDALWEHVQLGYIADDIETQSPGECLEKIQKNAFRMVQDGFFNPITGIGTGADPGRYNFATIPTIMSPMEATAYYSGGGIPKIIIDKKSKGVLLNGYGFEGNGWDSDETKELHEYMELTGYGERMSEGLRDGNCFGGGFLWPMLVDDNPYTTGLGLDDLIKQQILKKHSISHWAEADRWNCVLVPRWDVTARDYLYPRSIYVPIGGVKVATARAAVIRPSMLPYWGMIRQIGWTTPDFEGWIPNYMAYRLMIGSVPIMSQQMSLLFHVIPMDAALVENGIEFLKKYIAMNQKAMGSWSMLNPVAINSFGEVKAIERHFTDIDKLMLCSMQDLSASAGIPTSIIFNTQANGFSDQDDDTLLKQSETITLSQKTVGPQLSPTVRIGAISCFGPDYVDKRGVPIMDKLANLHVTFETPVVLTAQQRADNGVKFTQTIGNLVTAQVPIDVAFEVAEIFHPDVEMTPQVKARIEELQQLSASPPGYTPGGGMRELAAVAPEIATRLRQMMAAQPAPEAAVRKAIVADLVRNPEFNRHLAAVIAQRGN